MLISIELLTTLRLKVHCPVNTTPSSLPPVTQQRQTSTLFPNPYAVGAQRPLAPALVHAVGRQVSDKRSISGGICTFLNFIQLCFTSICNCDWAGNDLCLTGWQIFRDLVERACVHVRDPDRQPYVDNTILWRLTATSGATLWLRRSVVGRFRSSVINNGGIGNRLTDFRFTTLISIDYQCATKPRSAWKQ